MAAWASEPDGTQAGTSTAGNTATTGSGGAPEAGTQKVGWLELFYDLVFVVVVAQLSGHLHGDPHGRDVLQTLGFFLIVWTTWFNCVALTNLSHGLSSGARLWVLASMAGVGVMAVGAAPHEHRGATFAIGCALARLPLTPLWVRQRQGLGLGPARAVVFGLVISAGWAASALLHGNARTWAWVALMVVEQFWSLYHPAHGENFSFNSAHMLERIGAFVLICFGEGVAQLADAVNEHPTGAAWVTTAFGFVLVGALFWLFYDMALDRMEDALEARPDRLADVMGMGQFLVVVGLIGIAAGLAGAIEASATGEHMTHGARWVLCGGVAGVMLGNTSLTLDAMRVQLDMRRPTREERRERRRALRAARVGQPGRRQMGPLLGLWVLGRCLVVPVLTVWLGGQWPAWLLVLLLALFPLWNGLAVSLAHRRMGHRTPPAPDASSPDASTPGASTPATAENGSRVLHANGAHAPGTAASD